MLSQTSQTPKVNNQGGCKLSWQHSKQKALGILITFSLLKLIDQSTITECQEPKVRRATSVPSSHGVFTGHFILRTILAQI